MPKRSLRERLLRERRHCSPESCLRLSLEIQARFLAGDSYRRASSLGLYSPVMNEVLTEQIARQAWQDGKRVVYPRVCAAGLEYYEVRDFAGLAPGTFGIPEPTGSLRLPLDDIDVLVIPGVAFDLAGHRLGYGKGCYDRTLAGCGSSPERVGLAYEFQLVAQLPADVHDCRINRLVTEQRCISFSS